MRQDKWAPAASNSAGTVVSATTKSLMNFTFLLYEPQKPVTTSVDVQDTHLPLTDHTAPDVPASVTPSAAAPSRARARRRLVGLEARQRRQTVLRYVLLFVSAAFMVNALVGDNGLLATVKARRHYEAMQREVNALREENQRGKIEMDRLKNDPTAIEDEARKELGLIRPGETLVIVKDAQPVK
jgi:cell division protein FtsB